jgi:hypothetical protein
MDDRPSLQYSLRAGGSTSRRPILHHYLKLIQAEPIISGLARLPASRAYSTERGLIWVTTFRNSVQVSGVRFQRLNSTGCVGFAFKTDLLSPVLAFSCRLG